MCCCCWDRGGDDDDEPALGLDGELMGGNSEPLAGFCIVVVLSSAPGDVVSRDCSLTPTGVATGAPSSRMRSSSPAIWCSIDFLALFRASPGRSGTLGVDAGGVRRVRVDFRCGVVGLGAALGGCTAPVSASGNSLILATNRRMQLAWPCSAAACSGVRPSGSCARSSCPTGGGLVTAGPSICFSPSGLVLWASTDGWVVLLFVLILLL